jgi:hypothetical protein
MKRYDYMVTGITEGDDAEVVVSPASAPIKQDKKLNKALGEIFAVAAEEGAIPLDKTLAKALTRIRDTKTLAGDVKAALYDTIINHVAVDERYNVSLAVYQDNEDPTVERAMAARVYSDIELLDDAKKFDAALRVVQHVPIPSAEIAERIIHSVDALPQDEQFDALEEILPHLFPYGDLALEKMLDKIPNEYAPERYKLAMMIYDIAETEQLQERALEDALKYVDDAPAKDRTKSAVAIAFETHNAALTRNAIDVAIDHATVANKPTIKALEQALEAADALVDSVNEDLLSPAQVMGIETALYTLTENLPAKPAPIDPANFVLKMWATPAP